MTNREIDPLENQPEETLVDALFAAIAHVVDSASSYAKAAVDTALVYRNFEIGRIIVEVLQNGSERAEYGTKVIEGLSERLTRRFGSGFSVDNLKLMRRFYKVYAPHEIGEKTSPQFATPAPDVFEGIREKLSCEPGVSKAASRSRPFTLSWSHYVKLMRIDNPDERRFYEIEATKNRWGLKELQRQFDSALYERLALSRDKEGVARLAQEGQVVETVQDAFKDPYVLEFLGLPEQARYSEEELESRIIDHLQEFLLELGAGFAFMGRQVHISFEDEHFYIDLVFYNRLLRCFVLFDLKIGKLRHQDIGQMQMYVNYYDREVRLEDENLTIGILLCKDKKDSIVKMTLPNDNQQIFASKYLTVLPSKEALQKLLDEAGE